MTAKIIIKEEDQNKTTKEVERLPAKTIRETTITKCVNCLKTNSLLWRPLENGNGFLCHECHENKNAEKLVIESNEDANKKGEEEKPCCSKTLKMKESSAFPEINVDLIVPTRTLRKSTRARTVTRPTRLKSTKNGKNSNGQVTTTTNSGGINNKTQTKGRNRRSLFKKVPVKMPTAEQLSTRFVESVFHKGSYVQIGDIVSCVDSDGNLYYAQVRGLLIDSYCEKSAFLTWLIPTTASPDPNEVFDPATYIIGPDEDFSRRLSCLEFVMHAPSDYYLDRSTPFPPPSYIDAPENKNGYIWTSLPEIKRYNTPNDIQMTA